MTVSVLVATNRPEHLRWCLWQIEKQTRLPNEVIFATNYGKPELFLEALAPWEYTCDALLCYKPEGMPKPTLGELRQMALDAATGDVILWFDDDDWYHPRRIELCAAAVESGDYDVCSLPLTHFYYLDEQLAFPFPSGTGVHLPATAWRREIVKQVAFKAVATGEDHYWIHALVHPLDGSEPIIPSQRIRWISDYIEPHFGGMVTVHRKNAWQIPLVNRELTPIERYEGKPLPHHAPKDIPQRMWDVDRALLAKLREHHYGGTPCESRRSS